MKPRHETLAALIEQADLIRQSIPERHRPAWSDAIDNVRGCLRPGPSGRPRECERWDEATFRRVQLELLQIIERLSRPTT